MKSKIIILNLLVLINFVCFSQVAQPWEENYSSEPFKQGLKGQVLLAIKNKGATPDECGVKAQKQALYVVLFNGYSEANNIPASAAICQPDAYLANKDYFDNFFNSVSGITYKNYSPKWEIHPSKPVSKIDKKTVEANIIVTIDIDLLRQALEKQNIIKSLASFSFEPKVFVVPSDEWMKTNNYIIKTDNQGISVERKNYTDAIRDPKIGDAIASVKSYYEKPNGPFLIADLNESAGAINDEIQKANINNTQESIDDIFARVVGADIWVKVDLKEEKIEGGLKSQLTITLSYYDPYSGITKNGTPITKESINSNRAQLIKATMQGALDELRAKIFDDLNTKESKGMTGLVTFRLQTQDFDFNSEFPYKDGEIPLSQILDKIVKRKAMPSSTKINGANTATTVSLKTNIPMWDEEKGEDGEPDTKDPNTFLLFGAKVQQQLKKLGFTSNILPNGIGGVLIIITSKTQ